MPASTMPAPQAICATPVARRPDGQLVPLHGQHGHHHIVQELGRGAGARRGGGVLSRAQPLLQGAVRHTAGPGQPGETLVCPPAAGTPTPPPTPHTPPQHCSTPSLPGQAAATPFSTVTPLTAGQARQARRPPRPAHHALAKVCGDVDGHQVLQRLVHRRVVHVHNLVALLAVRLLDRLLEQRDGLRGAQGWQGQGRVEAGVTLVQGSVGLESALGSALPAALCCCSSPTLPQPHPAPAPPRPSGAALLACCSPPAPPQPHPAPAPPRTHLVHGHHSRQREEGCLHDHVDAAAQPRLRCHRSRIQHVQLQGVGRQGRRHGGDGVRWQ